MKRERRTATVYHDTITLTEEDILGICTGYVKPPAIRESSLMPPWRVSSRILQDGRHVEIVLERSRTL